MKFTGTYGFAAPAEVVYGTLTDPDRADRWLPPAVTAEVGADRVTVRAGGTTRGYQLTRSAADLRVSVSSTDLSATARVREGPAGGSTLEVEVDHPEPERIRGVVEEAVHRLRRDVSDNFTAG